MNKIKEIIIGTNNEGKYKEICALLPSKITKHSVKKFNIPSPKETGNTYADNSIIKAKYYSEKTNLICLADDSGLEIDVLNKEPGVYSSRWAEKGKNFDTAISKVYEELKKVNVDWSKKIIARFVCNLSIWWPEGKFCSYAGEIEGKISSKKRGIKGFGYDPIFIPNGHKETFGEMEPKLKMSIDHRFIAYSRIENFF